MKIMKSVSLLLLVISVLILGSCTQKQNESIEGKYFNQTFLNEIPGRVIGDIPVYCLELDFDKDSVLVSYGFEQAKLAYKKEGDHYLLINAVQDKDLKFLMKDDNSFTLLDSIWTGAKTNSVFKKVADDESFSHYINDKLVSGDYIVYEDGKATTAKVTLTKNGEIKGIPGFSSYAICYSGDCVQETAFPSNMVTINGKDTSETYSFEVDSIKEMLHICEIQKPIKGIKGERKVLDKVYDLRSF